MSIQSEINRIEQNIANAYSTLSARGATLPAEQNSENLASAISEIGGADWNQNDPTHPDYIENRTHYVIKTHDFSYSGPYNWEEIGPGDAYYAKGMRYTAYLGLFEDELFGNGLAPSLCDISNIRGGNCTEVPSGTIQSKSGVQFLWTAGSAFSNYCGISLYRSDSGSDIVPTMFNFKTLKQLPEAYIPDTIARVSDLQTHIADKNNPHGVTATQIGAIPNGGEGDYFLNGHLSFESSASDLLFSSDGIRATVYEQEGFETPVSRPIITVTTHDDVSNAFPLTTIAPGITHVGYDEYSDNTDIRIGRIEFYNQDGTIKIGITGDAQEVYDPDADSFVIGLADGDDGPIIVRGVNWPTQPNDATNKEYVDEQISSKIIIETTVVEGGSSPYPDGTIIFTKE